MIYYYFDGFIGLPGGKLPNVFIFYGTFSGVIFEDAILSQRT